jgi:hypothetical protein
VSLRTAKAASQMLAQENFLNGQSRRKVSPFAWFACFAVVSVFYVGMARQSRGLWLKNGWQWPM